MISFSLSNIKSVARVAKVTVVKHSPEILMGIGTISFVATVVTASKATLKAQDILENHKVELEDIKEASELNSPDYKPEDAKKDKITLYSQTGLALAKDYAPAAGFAAISLTCFFGAFNIMKKRYVVLAAAYSALETSFRNYRQRVIEDKGEDADIYYMTGQKVKEVTVKDEEGNKVKQKVLTLEDGTVLSPYAFKFAKYKENGELNNQWTGNPTLDRAYILGQQDYQNDQLYIRCVFDKDHKVIKRGWSFLNETRDLLGEDPTSTGAVVGNLFGNGEPGRDGYIDYRIIESTDRDGCCFYINPNVDGLIYDIVEKYEKVPFTPNVTFDQF